jgi:M6 family metalloprotease-like protein
MLKNLRKIIFVAMLLSLAACEKSTPVSSSLSSSSSSLPQPLFTQVSTIYNAHDLGFSMGQHYLPSNGTDNLLVIPVMFSDYKTTATSDLKGNIEKAFFGSASETGWQSLSSFYKTSSYGRLTLNGVVSDWYDCGYATADIDKDSSLVNTILKNGVEWYKTTFNSDGREFDCDQDGYIDGVWLVYGCPDYVTAKNNSVTLSKSFWAFTSWDNSVASVESPTTNTFGWASYDFLFEGYGSKAVDAHTFIHETGHMLGLQDYYDYDSKANPVGGIDMMDNNIVDHNAFSKFAFDWVAPYVVANAGSLYLKPFEESGQCVIIPIKDWGGSVFDEYLMMEYDTPTGLNEKDATSPYLGNGLQGYSQNGLRIFHVDARLAKGYSSSFYYTNRIVTSATTHTVLAHSNTASRNYLDGNNRLLQLIDCTKKRDFSEGRYYGDNSSLFHEGDVFTFEKYAQSFPNSLHMNGGWDLSYKVSVTAMTNEGVALSFAAL